MEYYEELKNKIAQELIKDGFANRAITYNVFLELYKPYKEELSEMQFAKIIGLKNDAFSFMKNRGTKPKILKTTDNMTEEIKEKIVQNLDKRGYRNTSIDYSEFLELYEPYKKELSENQFAEIIRIKFYNLQNIKYKKRKTKILETTTEMIERISDEIIQDLTKKGYENKLVDYKEFLELYEPYKNILTQKQFAEVINITYSNFLQMKNQGTRARVLKLIEKSSKEMEKEIIRKLIEKGYRNTSIDYSTFLNLYESYKKELSELEFAKIIGISYGAYRWMKTRRGNAVILKEISNEDLIQIEKEIIENLTKKGYRNALIKYSKFLELYEPYKNKLIQIEFAKIIGIEYGSFNQMKNKGTNVNILRTPEKIEKKIKQEIIENLLNKGYNNKLINYAEFFKLYEVYKNELSQLQFAEILGIRDTGIDDLKRNKSNSIIKFNRDKIDIINYFFRNNKYYTTQEIKELCNKLNISIEDLCIIIANNHKEIALEYKNVIEKREKIYFGKIVMPPHFLTKYADRLLSYCKNIGNYFGKKYKAIRLSEDISSEALIEVIENNGSIVINFDDETALNLLEKNCFTKIKYKYIKYFNNKNNKKLSLDKEYGEKKRYTMKKFIADETKNTENEAIDNIKKDLKNIKFVDAENESLLYDRCITLLDKCHEYGLDATESIEFICRKINIEKEKLLSIMEKCLIEKKKVRQTNNGDYMITER